MLIKETILSDIKTAMKEKDSKKLEVLRFINSQIKNKEIELRPEPLSESEVIKVLKKYLKQRQESMAQFKEHGRDDLVESEKYQAAVIEAYLPKMMSEEELKKVVDDVVSEEGATSMKDMGSVMQKVIKKTGDLADGKMISQLVKARLS